MKNKTLNILKAICAILIVFNHCTFPGFFGNAIKGISRIGVPIFFMISGYYVYNNSEEKILKKIKHIFIILIFSCLFWFLFNVTRFYFFEPEEFMPYLNSFLNIKTLIKFIFFNVNCFWGHLWFINALFYCYIIEFIIKRYKVKMSSVMYYLIASLLLIYVLINVVILKGNLSYVYIIRNFIFVGMPFFTIGKMINRNKITITSEKFFLNVIILLIICLIETHFYVSELYLSSIILAIYLFIIVINHPNVNIPFLEYIGDKMSMYIYVLHPAIKYFVIYISIRFHLIGCIWDYILPIIMLIITIILSYLLSKLGGIEHEKQN